MLRWDTWPYAMEKKDENGRLEVEHPKLVSRMTKSADGRTAPLKKITKPKARRREVQILKEAEEDVKPLARCEEKRKEWAKHWQCDTEVRNFEDE